MENILIIKHGALGDFVLALGVMKALRARHPEARFTLMTIASLLPIAKQTGLFDDYIVDERAQLWRAAAVGSVLRRLLAGRFHRVYDIQERTRTKTYRLFLRFFSPAGEYDWVRCYSQKKLHVSKRCRLGWGRETETPEHVPFPTPDLSFLHGKGEHFHLLPERFVMLVPGCSPQHPYKRWATENYRELVRRLAERGVSSVVIGTRAEADVVNAICEGQEKAVNMFNKTSLLDVPQIALRAVAVVGNDTGPSHMASLSGAYTIALYDQRNRTSLLHGPHCHSIISPAGTDLITVDEVWELLKTPLG